MAKKQRKPTDEIPTKGLANSRVMVGNIPVFKKASWAEMFEDYWKKRFSQRENELSKFPIVNLITDAAVIKTGFGNEREATVCPEVMDYVPSKIFNPDGILPTHSLEDYTDIPSLESHLFKEGAQLGNFSVGKKLGAGGMGAIFPISKNGSNYIIKIPLKEGVQKTSLENEIDVLSYLWNKFREKKALNPEFREPNIIKLHAFSKGQMTYAILEPLEGLVQGKKDPDRPALEKMCTARAGELQGQQPIRVARYVYDMAKSLEFLHAINIIHGDVKYHNCMDTHKNGRMEMILFDFGLAKILTEENEPNIRKCRKIGMTIHYITRNLIAEWLKYNEIFKECPLSRLRAVLKRADWEALALSAYHLLTGIQPYSLTNKPLVDGKYECPLNHTNEPIEMILNSNLEPIDNNIVRSMKPYGPIFAKIFQTLRDPAIILPETVQKVYSALKRGINQPGLFD